MIIGITLQILECNLFACVPGATVSLTYCSDATTPHDIEIDETINYIKDADHNSFFMNPMLLENV